MAPRDGTVVLGGGAAGMMAAISAAEGGEHVILLEANQQLGRKILISGNGRCNLTNLKADSEEHYHGGNPHFRRQVLGQYTLGETLDFFGRFKNRVFRKYRMCFARDQFGKYRLAYKEA